MIVSLSLHWNFICHDSVVDYSVMCSGFTEYTSDECSGSIVETVLECGKSIFEVFGCGHCQVQ